MQKHILVYLYYFHPFENANTNVILPLLDGLKEKYKVTIYTMDHAGGLPQTERWDGMEIIRDRRREKSFAHFVHMVYDSREDAVTGKAKWLKRLILRVFHRLISKERLEKLIPDCAGMRYRKVIFEEQYDALISVSAPIITQYETLYAARRGELQKHGIKWFPYLTDPHATFIGNLADREALMKKELEIFQLADAVFTTTELYEDNKNTPLGAYTYKTIAMSYGNLRPINDCVDIPLLDKEKINCVYLGSLFDISVRDPEYFYRLAEDCGDDFRFHIICYATDKENEKLREKYVDNNPNIIWHGRTGLEVCHGIMCHADILINLGNRTTNQTPSKIFDYIASGKPIVNIHALGNDTAKHYLERYPMKLNIQEKPVFDEGDRQRYIEFCREYSGTGIPFNRIRELYHDLVAENAVKKFVDTMDGLMKTEGGF